VQQMKPETIWPLTSPSAPAVASSLARRAPSGDPEGGCRSAWTGATGSSWSHLGQTHLHRLLGGWEPFTRRRRAAIRGTAGTSWSCPIPWSLEVLGDSRARHLGHGMGPAVVHGPDTPPPQHC